jgi:hypothetical protein
VLIAGPNLTIDRTPRLQELRPGEVLSANEAHASPGGKGVNVARAAAALGHRAELVAFLPRIAAQRRLWSRRQEPADEPGARLRTEWCTIQRPKPAHYSVPVDTKPTPNATAN